MRIARYKSALYRVKHTALLAAGGSLSPTREKALDRLRTLIGV